VAVNSKYCHNGIKNVYCGSKLGFVVTRLGLLGLGLGLGLVTFLGLGLV